MIAPFDNENFSESKVRISLGKHALPEVRAAVAHAVAFPAHDPTLWANLEVMLGVPVCDTLEWHCTDDSGLPCTIGEQSQGQYTIRSFGSDIVWTGDYELDTDNLR